MIDEILCPLADESTEMESILEGNVRKWQDRGHLLQTSHTVLLTTISNIIMIVLFSPVS